jgi:hypothetical protein
MMRRGFFTFVCALVTLTVTARAQESEYNLLDPTEMVLAVEDNGTRFSWQLQYGHAREAVIAALAKGDAAEAVGFAKTQFILCPLDDVSIEAAILSMSEALVALDSNDERAKAFALFARLGPAGEDGQLGTGDDLVDPISSVKALFRVEGVPDPVGVEAEIAARQEGAEEWQVRWYETEKAFAMLDRGDFDGALDVVVPCLAISIKYPAARVDGNWELQRNQDILDRIIAGLGVIYRSRNGTIAGVERFTGRCLDYARFGPVGKDDKMGTEDDIEPPV